MSSVHIVHCIDTEGPLYEPLDAKFDRLDDLFQITHIDRTWDNFRKLQNGEIPLDGKEDKIKDVFSSHLSNFMDSWDKVYAMLEKCMALDFRNRMTDSNGKGWVYNWFPLDHVGYAINPRGRDMGFHSIFDRYQEILRGMEASEVDGLEWHFHPMSTYREAHRCATHYLRSPEIFEILSRRIIERGFFPAAYRAGFQAERPDSHWFLEQWIPFDITNMSLEDNSDLERTVDFRQGRSGDWRRAPNDWSIYHPDHDDYQTPGNCRRAIARCLNVLNRIAPINAYEMRRAFQRATEGKPAVVGICSHDFRDLAVEVAHIRELIEDCKKEFPDVPFYFSEVRDAFRKTLFPNGFEAAPLDLDVTFHPESPDDVAHIEVSAKQGSVFGPQPWLAIETRSHRFLHDNFDFVDPNKSWAYAFHGDTLWFEDVLRIGVAANDSYGNTCVRVFDVVDGAIRQRNAQPNGRSA